MSNIGDMLVDVKGLKSVHDSIKNTFSTKQELTNVDNKFSEVNSARQSGNGTTYDNLKARLDADKEAAEKDIGALKADLGNIANLDTSVKTSIVDAINAAQADIDDAKDNLDAEVETINASINALEKRFDDVLDSDERRY